MLLSTYELGHQPVHLASPAAALRREGHETRLVDLAVDQLEPDLVDWAEAVAISVPMHTAMRLATTVATRIRTRRPQLPIALYGLYAGVGEELAPRTADPLLQGEYEPGLIDWVEGLSSGRSAGTGLVRHLGRSDFVVPERDQLPALDRYARLEYQGRSVLAGAVEASHGCRHRCRHCPIPAVYDGRIRVVPQGVVLADIDQLVAAGARHVSFGDADFLNAPRHSLDVLREAHHRHPDLSFDVTVKVEHIVDHETVWPELAGMGLLFVISAFESVDDQTLDILDKGHTVAGMEKAVEIIRSAGIHIRPTWLPFFPWTTTEQVAGIFAFLDRHGLVGATDPVQMAIKLLIPRGSLLETHPEVTPYLVGYDPLGLTWQWEFAHPGVETLQKELEAIASEASDCGRHATETLAQMRQVVERVSGVDLGPIAEGDMTPRLTESWFCCAEPTQTQTVRIDGLSPWP